MAFKLSEIPLKVEKAIIDVHKDVAKDLMEEAQRGYNSVVFDNESDASRGTVTVSMSSTEKSSTVSARGEEVTFIEFGSGVYSNVGTVYPLEKPAGIVGIGEYGLGKGKQRRWVFQDGDKKVFTRGIPAQMCMANGIEYAKQNADKHIKERLAKVGGKG